MEHQQVMIVVVVEPVLVLILMLMLILILTLLMSRHHTSEYNGVLGLLLVVHRFDSFKYFTYSAYI
ncbi:hypothetical protein J3Q64DRAFT_1852198 [Phycomyces blakesleeanus]|uniref:Uncharacterized protein n=1 Tax=Phycomyces blakesleeanus TaxID=4837 RepID=A0ABR3AQ04_PHYBL